MTQTLTQSDERMNVQLSLTVEVPQLDALRETLEKIGAQLMADMALLTQRIQEINTALQQESSEIQAVIAQLQTDTADQASVDMAVAQLTQIRDRIGGLVTPAPTP